MSETLRAQVTNADKLMDLSWLWEATVYAVADTISVYRVNNFSWSAPYNPILVYGGTVSEKTGQSNLASWDVIVVEQDPSGKLYVNKYDTSGNAKGSYKAETANGFVLLICRDNGVSVSTAVGDIVTISFDYKNTTGYNANGHGTVHFETPVQAEQKPNKDNTSKLTIVHGADTKDLIEVNLYDYGSNINEKYTENKKYPGFQQEYGSTAISSLASGSFNFGNNITADLDAGINGVSNKGGDINVVANSANRPISGAMLSTLGTDGYPALRDGTSLSYLFTDNTYATKKNTDNINGLFQYNSTTGAYTFNSRENHAQFNQDSNTFTLYEQILSPNFMMYPFGNFLPFNDITKLSAQTSTIDRDYILTLAKSAQYKANHGARAEYATLAAQLKRFVDLMDAVYPNKDWVAANCMNGYFEKSGLNKRFSPNEVLLQNLYSLDYDEPTDFYFGMEMKMNFMQPKGGRTGNDGQQPMVFYFTGDDDVWVYVDGKLFLDLSGIHRHVGGEIDFEKGEVRYYALDTTTGDVSATPYKTQKFADILGSSNGLNEKGTFQDYSTHSFNFYYMERGSGSGVCRMNFNFPLLHKNSISVSKELSADEQDKLPLLGNPDFRFQVLKADADGKKRNDLFIGAKKQYYIYDSNNTQIGTGTTDDNGVFTLKAGQRAEFTGIAENAGKYYVRELLDKSVFDQYGTISVDGTSQTTNYDVTVGSDDFKGLDSPVKDVSDGSTVFNFNNQVTFKKLGSLEITKTLNAYSTARSTPSFDFEVTLDGTLPKYFCSRVPMPPEIQQYWQHLSRLHQPHTKPVNIGLHQIHWICATCRQKRA